MIITIILLRYADISSSTTQSGNQASLLGKHARDTDTTAGSVISHTPYPYETESRTGPPLVHTIPPTEERKIERMSRRARLPFPCTIVLR